MLNQKDDHVSRHEREPSVNAMVFAQRVADEYQKLVTSHNSYLYYFFSRALTSYRKFLKDPDSYKELLRQDNIYRLREKPYLKATSRLVLYFHTNAQSEAERNTAGRFARVVDYLHKERVESTTAAEYVRNAGGMDAILKKARGRAALKATDQKLETPTRTAASGDELFDPERDLSIRVRRETLVRVLADEIEIGETFYLECRKAGSVGRDGIRIVGRLLDPVSA